MKGSVYKQGSSWCYVVDIGRDMNGKRKQKRKRGYGCKEEAVFALHEYIESGILIDSENVKYVDTFDSVVNPEEINKVKVKKNSCKEESESYEVVQLNYNEKFIEKILINNLDLIEDGMIFVGSQVSVDGGFVDILARDKSNKLVIIEVKINSYDERVVSQVLFYPSQFEEECRVIVIAPDYNKKIRYSMSQINQFIRKVELKQLHTDTNKINGEINLNIRLTDFNI